jgi:hypothetical protein
MHGKKGLILLWQLVYVNISVDEPKMYMPIPTFAKLSP